MANIGISKASYYADTSLVRYSNEGVKSVDRLSSAQSDVVNGEVATFSGMNYTFKMDIAAAKASIQSLSTTQAYLTTAITALDNASHTLSQIQELAVLGANGSNSEADHAAFNARAEELADQFHGVMSGSKYKDENIFDPKKLNAKMANGSGGSIDFGLAEIDYDFFYDYENPEISILNDGIKYEITRELTEDQKNAILSKTEGLTAADLIVGSQFTTVKSPENNVGLGDMSLVDDNAPTNNTRTYNVNSGALRIDGSATLNVEGDFKGGTLNIEVSNNSEDADNLMLRDVAGNTISIVDSKVYYDDPNLNERIEIGMIDEIANGQNGRNLTINLNAYASIPGTSNVKNGDFANWSAETVRYRAIYQDVQRTEDRTGHIDGFKLADGTPIAVGIPATSTHMNVELTSSGAGSGVRANLRITQDLGGNDIISAIHIIDGGGGYAVDDVLVDPNSGLEVTVASVSDTTVALTRPLQREVSRTVSPVLHTEGGFYDWDLTGADAADPADRVEYFEDQQVITRTVTQTPNNDVFNAETGTWVRNPAGVTYDTTYQLTPQTRTDITYEYNGEEAVEDSVFQRYDPVNEDRADFWTFSETRTGTANETFDRIILDNGVFSVYEDWINDPIAGTISPDLTSKVDVPSPTNAELAQVVYRDTSFGSASNVVKGVDNRPIAGNFPGNISNSNNRLNLETGQFDFNEGWGVLHGPAAVSDEFIARQGQFLKLDYTANAGGDDYHVVGYIYDVDTNDITMAFTDTAKNGSGTASIEVERTGNYRFVFIVGTFDESGGRRAGAGMTIDNIRAEDPYNIEADAIQEILRALHYENGSNAATATKTISATVSNAADTSIIRDDALLNMSGFTTTGNGGPYMVAPTQNLVTSPEAGVANGSASALTSKVELLQQKINALRMQAGSKVSAIESAIDSATDLRSQFALASGTLSDINFSLETVHAAKRQIQQDVAAAMMAQANKSQDGMLSLVAEVEAKP